MDTVRYKHARFSARFPTEFRYSASHYWMARDSGGNAFWRVGFTKFATRMLGELVEASFDPPTGASVGSGEVIGTVEGFKAASDVYCVMDGAFRGMNPVLREDACIVRSSPYETGWLYAVDGEPEQGNMSVHEYIEHLDAIIRRMAEEMHGES